MVAFSQPAATDADVQAQSGVLVWAWSAPGDSTRTHPDHCLAVGAVSGLNKVTQRL